MIFDSNMTGLSASTIPMAEGYDCSYGAALALVESARNDLAVFRAMLNVDARETAIKRENGGYLTEAQHSVICESAISGIWSKIKEFFAKLVAKVKAIFHTLISKLDAITKSNKELVKKYETEVLRKSNIGNLEVKWRKAKDNKTSIDLTKDFFEKIVEEFNYDKAADNYKPDLSDRNAVYMKGEETAADFKDLMMDEIFEDDSPSTYQIKEIGGIRDIISTLKESDKFMSTLNSAITKGTNKLDKLVKDADQNAKDVAKAEKGENGDQSKVDRAEHIYEMSQSFQAAVLALMDVTKEACTIEIKQAKAAFVKAIAANNSKLEESYVYLDALAEAAEQEVEDVINTAISSDGSELSELNNASRNVLDGGVSDDPDRLVYGEDPDYERAKVDGTIRTDYSSREESAFFAAPLY